MARMLKTIAFHIYFEGFLRFRGSILGSKIDLGKSWKNPGGVLGLLEGIWGRLLGHLGRLQAVLAMSWGHLDSSWGRLGDI